MDVCLTGKDTSRIQQLLVNQLTIAMTTGNFVHLLYVATCVASILIQLSVFE